MRLAISSVLARVQRVLLSQLSSWLLHGELLAADHHFFICKASAGALSTAALGAADSVDDGRVESPPTSIVDETWFPISLAR